MLKDKVAENLRADIHAIVSQGCRLCDYWDAENYHCMLNIPIHPAYPCNITDQILNLFKAEVDKLTVIDGKEFDELLGIYTRNVIHTERLREDKGLTSVEWSNQIFEHQNWLKDKLQDTKKQLLEGLEEG